MSIRTQYLTDLTDEEWAIAFQQVFLSDPGAGKYREVLNALLFRHRALLPWHLFPEDFGAIRDLQMIENVWKRNGTWARIENSILRKESPSVNPYDNVSVWKALAKKALGQLRGMPGRRILGKLHKRHPDNDHLRIIATVEHRKLTIEESKLRKFRRSMAKLAKKTPGGIIPLMIGRKTIQSWQGFRAWAIGYGRLPKVYLKGIKYSTEREFDKAIGCFEEVLSFDPLNLPTWLAITYAHMQMEDYEKTIKNSWLMLSFNNLNINAILQIHFYLSESYTQIKDYKRGISHGYFARIVANGEPFFWENTGKPDLPHEFEIMTNVHNDLAEHVINTRTNFSAAEHIYQLSDGIKKQYANWLGTKAQQTLFLSEDWTRNIGHMALIDFWIKVQKMGWQKWDKLVLLAPKNATANASYLEYYRPYFQIVDINPIPQSLRHLCATLGPRVASILQLPEGKSRYFTEGMGVIQQHWENSHSEPILRLSPDHVEYGREQLAKVGVPKDAWFVCFHVRSSGFHKEGRGNHQSHRNAEIETYIPAMQEVVNQGGWVIRLGDSSMPKLPPMPGIIDYPHTELKSSRMDIFLCGACRMFVGVASGLCHIPTTFGIPCALTNWLSNALPVYSHKDLFIPKRLVKIANKQILTLDEYFSENVRLLCYSGMKLFDEGYRHIDNTEDEILEITKELLTRVQSSKNKIIINTEQLEFKRIAEKHGLIGFSQISPSYLSKHSTLLRS